MSKLERMQWSPIEDLPVGWAAMRDPGIAALVQVWREQVVELKDQEVHKAFVAKLRREWAIETGVLERLYEISDSATKTLIEHGLDQSLLVSSDTDKPVDQVMALIRDQESAINGMYQFVAEGRSLTTGYIQQLHQVLTAHQPTCEARDTQGNVVNVLLRRGAWKSEVNNIEFADGSSFEFCPPALVESQMLNLLDWFDSHAKEGVSTEIQAAWLHHRFTLIHPFQDGNGRIARCLASLVMLKDGWFPLVVTRNDKPKYIGALRAADRGDLLPLVQLFNELQRRAIRRALGLSQDVLAASKSVSDALAVASSRLSVRAKALRKEQEKVHILAEALRISAAERLKSVAVDTAAMLKKHDPRYNAVFDESSSKAGRDDYYRLQVVECAKKLDYFANLPEYRAWALVALVTDVRVEILFHFHGIGHDAKGVLCCSAIYCQKDETRRIVSVDALADAPFEFTYRDDPHEVSERFTVWVESCVGMGINRWTQTL